MTPAATALALLSTPSPTSQFHKHKGKTVFHYKERSTDEKWLPPLRSATHPNPTLTQRDSWQTDPDGIVVFTFVPKDDEMREQPFGAQDHDGAEGDDDPDLDGDGDGSAESSSGPSGAPKNQPFSPDDILEAVREFSKHQNANGLENFTKSDMNEWEEWKRNCPVSLAQVPAEQRASLEMPTPYEALPPEAVVQHMQTEIITYANPNGGRVNVKGMQAAQGAARRILVSIGDNVALSREKPCTSTPSAKPAWNVPFYLAKVLAVRGEADKREYQIQRYGPYAGLSYTSNVNDKWRLMTLAQDKGRDIKYTQWVDWRTIGAVIHINKDHHLSAQSVKDLVDLQYNLCPPGSPKLCAIPPPQAANRNCRWTIGLQWAGE